CDSTVPLSIIRPGQENPVHLNISPNPFNDHILINIKNHINEGTSKFEVSLFSLEGKKITEQSFNTENIHFQVPAVPVGLYLLKIQSGCETTFKKIIKQ